MPPPLPAQRPRASSTPTLPPVSLALPVWAGLATSSHAASLLHLAFCDRVSQRCQGDLLKPRSDHYPGQQSSLPDNDGCGWFAASWFSSSGLPHLPARSQAGFPPGARSDPRRWRSRMATYLPGRSQPRPLHDRALPVTATAFWGGLEPIASENHPLWRPLFHTLPGTLPGKFLMILCFAALFPQTAPAHVRRDVDRTASLCTAPAIQKVIGRQWRPNSLCICQRLRRGCRMPGVSLRDGPAQGTGPLNHQLREVLGTRPTSPGRGAPRATGGHFYFPRCLPNWVG